MDAVIKSGELVKITCKKTGLKLGGFLQSDLQSDKGFSIYIHNAPDRHFPAVTEFKRMMHNKYSFKHSGNMHIVTLLMHK